MTPIFKCLICRKDIERSTKTFWKKKGHLLCSTCLDNIEKIDGSKKMADYHENFISTYTEKLLNEAIEKKEIQQINTKVFAVLFSSIGREFLNEKNRKSISTTPDENANSITSIILNGIKLKN